MISEFWSAAGFSLLLLVIFVAVYFIRQGWDIWKESLRAKVGATRWELLRGMARTLILAAEQMAQAAGLDTGEKKKQFVVERLVAQAAALGITIDAQFVDTLVEGVLKEIKRESASAILKEVYSSGYTTGYTENG